MSASLPRTDRKKLVVDLDGTLCTITTGLNKYFEAEPKQDVIDAVNKMWLEGWHVTVFTARGMETCDGDPELAYETWHKFTYLWLREHRVCFDILKFGKPSADLYLDDKSMRPDDIVVSKGL